MINIRKLESELWESADLLRQGSKLTSNQLRRELPGLRGFSATSLRNMRKFYENWIMLDGNSASALAELQSADNQNDIKSASTLAENSTTAIADISSVATDESFALTSYVNDILFVRTRQK